MRADERGLAVGLAVFIAGLAIAAFLFTLLYSNALDSVFTMTADQADSARASDEIQLAQAIANNIMWVPLLFGALYLIVRAVIEGSAT